MATIQGVTVAVERGVLQTTWAGFAASADVGTTEQLGRYPVKNVQISGTFTGAPTIIMECSEDGVTFFPLLGEAATDAAISATGNGEFIVVGNPRFIRPRATAGSGGATVTVILTSKVFGN